MSPFRADVYQNEYLAVGATRVDAIIRVGADGLAHGDTPRDRVGDAETAEAAEVILVDVSGSMRHPPAKINAAKAATAAAIDCLRDGVHFAIVAGSQEAYAVYPETGGLAVTDDRTRREAKTVVEKLKVRGGTAIGRWLSTAAELFDGVPDAIHHAILLTDGQNEHETPEELAAALAHCDGLFQCDCRGVGSDWNVDELRAIATRLLGTVDIIARPEAMAADFTAIMHAAMGKSVATASLRVWTPKDAHVEFLKQVDPTIEDLTTRRVPMSDLVGEYPTGAWGNETRDYHLRIHVPAQDAGQERLVGRVHLVVGDDTVTEAKILAVGTDDQALSTKINREVARATGQAEMAGEIQQGIKAWEIGDHATATVHLGRAVRLAHDAGDTDRLDQLRGFVDIDPRDPGTVRIRRDASKIDAMTLDTRSTKTVRRTPPTPSPGHDGGP